MIVNIPVDFSDEIEKLINESIELRMKDMEVSIIRTKAYMNIIEACEYINISYPTFRKLEDQGLKSIKVENKRLYKKETIDTYLQGFEN